MVLTQNKFGLHYTDPNAKTGDTEDPTKVTSRHKKDQHSKVQNPEDPMVEDDMSGENSFDNFEDDRQDTPKDDDQYMPANGVVENKDNPYESDPVAIMAKKLQIAESKLLGKNFFFCQSDDVEELHLLLDHNSGSLSTNDLQRRLNAKKEKARTEKARPRRDHLRNHINDRVRESESSNDKT
uniref:Uncharacterized protein n=1 Tax=Cannabis sativa TaxID=3483 RepID=A0A803PQ20_CANSA